MIFYWNDTWRNARIIIKHKIVPDPPTPRFVVEIIKMSAPFVIYTQIFEIYIKVITGNLYVCLLILMTVWFGEKLSFVLRCGYFLNARTAVGIVQKYQKPETSPRNTSCVVRASGFHRSVERTFTGARTWVRFVFEFHPGLFRIET